MISLHLTLTEQVTCALGELGPMPDRPFSGFVIVSIATLFCFMSTTFSNILLVKIRSF